MAEPGDVWWEIDIVARNLLKVSLPSGVLRMPPDQARRFAQALNLAADATGESKRPSTSEDRCAPLVAFAEDVVDLVQGSPDLNVQAERILKWARAALRAHREREGGGDG